MDRACGRQIRDRHGIDRVSPSRDVALGELQVLAVDLEFGRRGLQELVAYVDRRGQDRAIGVERCIRVGRGGIGPPTPRFSAACSTN